MKKCTKCKKEQEPREFYKDKSRHDGLAARCKTCEKSRDRKEERSSKWASMSEREKARGGIVRHGITLEQYEALLEEQDGHCAACDATEANAAGWRLFIDHDHSCCPGVTSCGKCVRGLLCGRCNSVLGYALDDANRLSSLINYLKEGPVRRPGF